MYYHSAHKTDNNSVCLFYKRIQSHPVKIEKEDTNQQEKYGS